MGKGTQLDGSDSLAVQVAPREHWPDLHALVVVVSDDKKGTPPLLACRGLSKLQNFSTSHQECVPAAWLPSAMPSSKTLASLHRSLCKIRTNSCCCAGHEPANFYMNDVSRAIIALMSNTTCLGAADASSKQRTLTMLVQPVIYAPVENIREIVNLIVAYFPHSVAFKDPFGLFGLLVGPESYRSQWFNP